MNKDTLQLVDKLATKLGTTAEYLWRVLINQTRIELLKDVAWAIVALAYLIALISLTRYLIRRKNEAGSYDDDVWMVAIIVSVFIACVMVVVLINCVSEIPTLIYNPEYWALSKVLKAAK